MDSLNTPRRVTRASMAALSASKNSPNLLASPASTAKLTSARKRAAAKTPTVSTGKRGRPPKSTVEEIKENIPNEVTKSAQKKSIARKILHLEPPAVEKKEIEEENMPETAIIDETIPEIPDIELEESKIEGNLIVPEVKILEATVLDGTLNEGAKGFNETLNFLKLEEPKNTPVIEKMEVEENLDATFEKETAIEETKINKKAVFEETLNFSKLEEPKIVGKVETKNDKKAVFEETLNFSKLEEPKEGPAIEKMETDEKLEPTVGQESKVPTMNETKTDKKGNFKETLNFSKLEQASPIVKTEKLLPETVDLTESPVIITENEPESTPEIPETANLAPETINLTESPIVATSEDEYLAKLCAESGVEPKASQPLSETVNETVDMEETAAANNTFEIDDSVFAADMSTVSTGKSSETSTIVIEDTPLKPKTPQITMRRPFRRQQNLEVPESLSVSCIGEKSILKRKKRSLSTGDIRVNMTMQERRVKFHSPANQTVHIDEIDHRLLKGFTETNGRHQRAARRKRSLSDADYTQLKKESSAKKTFKSKKMPDFASIHSKQINKMESIADNLARKQERALALTTPDRKKATSDTKNDLSLSEMPSTSSEIVSSTILSHVSEEKIDEPIENPELIATETDEIQEEIAPVLEVKPNHAKSEIPKPVATIKPQKSTEKSKKPVLQAQFKAKIQFGVERKKAEGQKTPVFNFAAKSALAEIKKNNESALVKPVNLTAKLNITTQVSVSSSTAEMPSTSQTARKAMPTREERHKNLYKANKLCGKEGGKGMLKGVRLNKRFELQMAYRNMKKE